jgi:hypothetical protein
VSAIELIAALAVCVPIGIWLDGKGSRWLARRAADHAAPSTSQQGDDDRG